MTLDCSNDSEGNRDDEWNFVEGKRQTLCFIHLQETIITKKDKKNLQRKLVDYCPKKSITSNEPYNTKTKWIEMYQSQ